MLQSDAENDDICPILYIANSHLMGVQQGRGRALGHPGAFRLERLFSPPACECCDPRLLLLYLNFASHQTTIDFYELQSVILGGGG